ncbi:Coenzyme F420 hydrogenase/dehydrogenase, beta subunit C-terminal domain [Rhodococcus sp. Leaf278]|uniref:Coenzyme F420 hydrogenase/dehydrogenase, beta subunit C-terminal domain n=1 Tax=Rhodococcus sp. Leaf278 TaxID=1736319 RepID=UPI0009E80A2D|nr:Coenzyme F420 hydrogenase/dehydrogenase, beta subunit C-terminal domain [Rhodococcus sp. Leaf278]
MQVLRNDNCSGCGGCALVSDRITIGLAEDSYMRPALAARGPTETRAKSKIEADRFKAMCPGIRVSAPTKHPNQHSDDTFGSYSSAWVGWAMDPEIRLAGSSAGVITAFTNWLVETKRVDAVVASQEDPNNPRITVPLKILSRDDAMKAAGSRYAPVANLPMVAPSDFARHALVGKPCEATALTQLSNALSIPEENRPITVSFFCAGTPRQSATDGLADLLDASSDQIKSLRYRGDGWPGTFKITLKTGEFRTMSYDESWGTHLGRTVQWRCKLCVDGTGGHADIAVGDYWEVDSKGYPAFENADGRSVVIARTPRGEELLAEATRDGALSLSPLDLKLVAAVQPLQVDRKFTLAARLLGRTLAGKRTPRYSGYGLARLSLTTKSSLKAAAGTFVRTRQGR